MSAKTAVVESPEDGRTGNVSSLTQHLIGPIFRKSLFWRAKYLADSPFLAHLPFAFWLMETARPRTAVSLGLTEGVAYFGLCQAIDKFDLSCAIFGFGAEPAADDAEGQALKARLRAYNAENYPDVSTLAFGDPLAQTRRFKPGSIDLLYIDVPLDERAATALAEDWWPLLSDRGLVLINNIEHLAGSAGDTFLADLENGGHDVIRLDHGGGMLLALVGRDQPERLRAVAQLGHSQPGHAELRTVFARLGAAHETEWLSRTLGARAEAARADAEAARSALEETTETLAGLERSLEDHRASENELNGRLADLLSEVKAETGKANKLFSELETERTARQQEQAELNQIRESAQAAAERVKALELRLAKAETIPAAAAVPAAETEALNRQIADLNLQISDRFEEIANLTRALDETFVKDERIADLEAQLARLTAEHDESMPQIEQLQNSLEKTNRVLDRRETVLQALSAARARLTAARSKRWLSKEWHQMKAQTKVLHASSLFNAQWYKTTYPDVAGYRGGPAEHYITNGAYEGRDPGPDFSSLDYYMANRDVARNGMCALVHYELFGRNEGRKLK